MEEQLPTHSLEQQIQQDQATNAEIECYLRSLAHNSKNNGTPTLTTLKHINWSGRRKMRSFDTVHISSLELLLGTTIVTNEDGITINKELRESYSNLTQGANEYQGLLQYIAQTEEVEKTQAVLHIKKERQQLNDFAPGIIYGLGTAGWMWGIFQGSLLLASVGALFGAGMAINTLVASEQLIESLTNNKYGPNKREERVQTAIQELAEKEINYSTALQEFSEVTSTLIPFEEQEASRSEDMYKAYKKMDEWHTTPSKLYKQLLKTGEEANELNEQQVIYDVPEFAEQRVLIQAAQETQEAIATPLLLRLYE